MNQDSIQNNYAKAIHHQWKMKFIVWGVKIFRDYVVFSKSVLFMLGLIFSYKLVEKLIFNILITHLAYAWKNSGLRKAAIAVSLQEGICAVLQIFFAFVADAYSGLFKMVVSSTTLCIIGLWLFHFAAGNHDESLELRFFYPALVLMTLSQAALIITLQSFLGDQLVESNQQPATPEEEERAKKRSKLENEERAQKWPKSEKEETAQKDSKLEEEQRAQKRSKFWWTFVSFLAGIFALFGPLKNDSFGNLSMILAIVMGAAFLLFLLGIKSYTCVPPTGSALRYVVLVIHRAIAKRNVEHPQNPEEILPHVSWLRWLDREMIKQESNVEQVRVVKVLLKMLPMWATFLAFSFVAASGSTFFLIEATTITDETFPILLLINLQRLTEFLVTEISDYVLEKLGEEKKEKKQRMMLVRIGIGMVCCVPCCIAAWANALHGLQLVRKNGHAKNYMSVYRLIPQYLLLALMEGLSAGGLQNFFHFHVSRSMSKYGPPLGECVMGNGRFLNIGCILILCGWFEWFGDGLEPCRLDKYYTMLAILSSLNVILYCFVAYWYGDDPFLSGDATDTEMGIVNSNSELHGHDRLPLLETETGQEITSSSSSSTTFLADNSRRDDREGETLKPNVFDSTDQASLLASQSTKNGPSDASSLNVPRSFSRPSSRGVYRHFRSMR